MGNSFKSKLLLINLVTKKLKILLTVTVLNKQLAIIPVTVFFETIIKDIILETVQ